MFDMHMLGTMAMAAGLVAAAGLALWQLPWSAAELEQAEQEAKAAASRLASAAKPERQRVRVYAR